jgi:hypothetical protein
MEKAFYHLRKALQCMEEQGLGEEMEKIRKKFMKEMMGHRMSQRMGQRMDSPAGPGTYRTATGYKENNKPGSRSRYADEYEESLQHRMNRKHQEPFDPDDWEDDD